MAKSEKLKKRYGIFVALDKDSREKMDEFGYRYHKDFADDHSVSVETLRRWRGQSEFLNEYVEPYRKGKLEASLGEMLDRLIDLATDKDDPDRKAIELAYKLAGREPVRKSKKEVTKTEKTEQSFDEFDEGLAKWLGQVFKQAGLLKDSVSEDDIVEATSKVLN